jgi:hypothetical protein
MVLSWQRREKGPDLKMSCPDRTAKRTKPKPAGPPIVIFGDHYRRAFEAKNARDANHYGEYTAWCSRVGLPAADFQTWRATLAKIKNA